MLIEPCTARVGVDTRRSQFQLLPTRASRRGWEWSSRRCCGLGLFLGDTSGQGNGPEHHRSEFQFPHRLPPIVRPPGFSDQTRSSESSHATKSAKVAASKYSLPLSFISRNTTGNRFSVSKSLLSLMSFSVGSLSPAAMKNDSGWFAM